MRTPPGSPKLGKREVKELGGREPVGGEEKTEVEKEETQDELERLGQGDEKVEKETETEIEKGTETEIVTAETATETATGIVIGSVTDIVGMRRTVIARAERTVKRLLAHLQLQHPFPQWMIVDCLQDRILPDIVVLPMQMNPLASGGDLLTMT